MQAELLSVGTELLLGQIVDTNATYLAQKLSELGIDLYFKTTVGDNPARLTAALKAALDRADLVISTGGLGPTQDDLTTETVASALGRKLVLDAEAADRIRQFFAFRGITDQPLLQKNLRQALLPESAVAIPNPSGTAPGFMLEVDGRTVVSLPGVPSEMKAMFEQTLTPYLRSRAGEAVILSRVLKFTGVGESQLEELVRDLVESQTNPTIAFAAKSGEVHIRLTAKAKDRRQAGRALDQLEEQVRFRASEYVFGSDQVTLEGEVGRLLRERGLTLGVAESCTGGLVSHRLTNIAGSSHYFRCGVVSYSNESKVRLLGVPAETIAAQGAVSPEVALGMARGARAAAAADLGLAVTGIAGPGGSTPEKPVGLVYVALIGEGWQECQEYRFGGGRDEIKQRASQAALEMARRKLAEPMPVSRGG